MVSHFKFVAWDLWKLIVLTAISGSICVAALLVASSARSNASYCKEVVVIKRTFPMQIEWELLSNSNFFCCRRWKHVSRSLLNDSAKVPSNLWSSCLFEAFVLIRFGRRLVDLILFKGIESTKGNWEHGASRYSTNAIQKSEKRRLMWIIFYERRRMWETREHRLH